MRGTWIGRTSALLLCGSLHLVASATGALPTELTGTWGTAASLYEGDVSQSELYILGDGFGVAAGSTPPARRIDGKDDGKAPLRALVGFPFHATLDGDILKLRILLPDKATQKSSGEGSITCNYEPATPTLRCAVPNNSLLVLTRRSTTVPDEMVRTIESIRPSDR